VNKVSASLYIAVQALIILQSYTASHCDEARYLLTTASRSTVGWGFAERALPSPAPPLPNHVRDVCRAR